LNARTPPLARGVGNGAARILDILRGALIYPASSRRKPP
jgi:hypothetical protein